MNNEKKLYPVKFKKRYGYIDKEGNVVIEYKFNYAEEFEGDLAIVGIDEKYGFINKDGEFVIEPKV